ncbi:hypothetical protein B7435_22970 [Mycolicibacterium peregrinum]|uniref:hypothetical protein n=1 Tax=Mycolicibacterium peregrinum TaxID=43304 RepID=UPI000B4A6C91|nr:hypothetical protein [Mycolicibacterium peregrinum]OWL99223.1 hypothetical protein B7435_22970 [Mycolicibacterium peregrinum]
MSDFRVDPAQLAVNSTANAEHAARLKEWIDQYDNPQRYELLLKRFGLVAYPVVEALRRHGAQVRQRTEELIASYELASRASTASAERSTRTDDEESRAIRSTVLGI